MIKHWFLPLVTTLLLSSILVARDYNMGQARGYSPSYISSYWLCCGPTRHRAWPRLRPGDIARWLCHCLQPCAQPRTPSPSAATDTDPSQDDRTRARWNVSGAAPAPSAATDTDPSQDDRPRARWDASGAAAAQPSAFLYGSEDDQSLECGTTWPQ